MTALSLSAVGCFWWKSNVTLSANHLLSFVLSGESGECGFDLDLSHTTSSKSEDEMESGLLLDVVVGEGSSVFKLLSGKDESLLIRWDSFFILNLSLDVFNGVSRLDVKSDCLARQGLDKNLHIYLSNND